MLRFLVTILISFISFGFAAEVMMANKSAATKNIFAENEQQDPEQGNGSEKGEESGKEKLFAHPSTTVQAMPLGTASLSLYNQLFYSPGFTAKPYMPPELM